MPFVICPKCGQEVNDAFGSCIYCGSSLEGAAPANGAEVNEVTASPEVPEQVQPVQQSSKPDNNLVTFAICSFILAMAGGGLWLIGLIVRAVGSRIPLSWLSYIILALSIAAIVLGIIGLVKYFNNKKTGNDKKSVMIFSIIGIAVAAILILLRFI